MSLTPAHGAAQAAAAVYTLPNPGTLRLSGPSRVEYLQRQTSNDLGLLSAEQAVSSLLTSAQGRVLEYFSLLPDQDELLMLTQPGHGPGLAAYFSKRIFFNDQVSIHDQSAAWAQLELHGPQAAQQLTQTGLAPSAQLDGFSTGTWQGHPVFALTQPGFVGAHRYLLLLPAAAAAGWLATFPLPQLDLASREHLRIAAGLAGDPEFNHQYTPFELGLERLVSATKGCYTGQEVLARQVTYDKVTRSLVRLSSPQALPAGQRLFAAGKPLGEVTSSTQLASGSLALAVLRRAESEANHEFSTETGQIAVKITDS